jgi:hypothetical protein
MLRPLVRALLCSKFVRPSYRALSVLPATSLSSLIICSPAYYVHTRMDICQHDEPGGGAALITGSRKPHTVRSEKYVSEDDQQDMSRASESSATRNRPGL